MRGIRIAAFALCGIAVAVPNPQTINIEAALAVPTPTILGPKIEDTAVLPVSYDPVAAVIAVAKAIATSGVETKKLKRAACDVQPGGVGPVPGDGSVGAYTNVNGQLRKNARAVSTPTGYKKVFTDKLAATEQIGHLTYKNIDSGKYDVNECAKFCDKEKYCLGFNIYYERDPKREPAAACPNPSPITNVKCSIYGYHITENSATNAGQKRQNFQVAITGSNGYSKVGHTCHPAPSVKNFKPPTDLPAAINAPLIKKNGRDYDTYNGMRLFNTNPHDPSLCGAACEAQTEYDRKNLVNSRGEYKPCNFFTSYILTKNGVPLGTYCALYTQEWNPSYATNTGYKDGNDVYKVTCAASYTASKLDSGKITTTP
ncbi:hypothetical protein BKA66DRAFT_466170 [Pyrenochaeta sp. MPI-SDFR-AT-0127]|nr:hypothetical protein BKA66DRAFT_466170 [Pyrenochaeta sp. MPI-SDFR-AT-0127]